KQDGFDTVYEYESVDGIIGVRSNLVDVKMNESANGYRLPTEAEWEYAYKGGTFTDFYWGKDYSWYEEDESRNDYTDHGAMKTNAWDEGITTYPVAYFSANNYGLYDMAGNLAEFCNNQPYLYKYGSITDPMVTSVYKTGTQRMIRGGAWNNEVCYLRGSNRTFYASDYAYWYIGFRVVRVEK
ncbi:MAG: formylglycine-generating enzyme family protein, partial [Fibrobacter sp.]|nr:formylglycine-generating enzyme family protein [Fibrobacter sp.]